jgi:hypothetical protein
MGNLVTRQALARRQEIDGAPLAAPQKQVQERLGPPARRILLSRPIAFFDALHPELAFQVLQVHCKVMCSMTRISQMMGKTMRTTTTSGTRITRALASGVS